MNAPCLHFHCPSIICFNCIRKTCEIVGECKHHIICFHHKKAGFQKYCLFVWYKCFVWIYLLMLWWNNVCLCVSVHSQPCGYTAHAKGYRDYWPPGASNLEYDPLAGTAEGQSSSNIQNRWKVMGGDRPAHQPAVLDVKICLSNHIHSSLCCVWHSKTVTFSWWITFSLYVLFGTGFKHF